LSFAIIHSTTKALPIWRSRCIKAGLKANLIPREDDEWTVVKELVAVLEVAACLASDQVILGTYLIHW
jgi:hypothetical protein